MKGCWAVWVALAEVSGSHGILNPLNLPCRAPWRPKEAPKQKPQGLGKSPKTLFHKAIKVGISHPKSLCVGPIGLLTPILLGSGDVMLERRATSDKPFWRRLHSASYSGTPKSQNTFEQNPRPLNLAYIYIYIEIYRYIYIYTYAQNLEPLTLLYPKPQTQKR